MSHAWSWGWWCWQVWRWSRFWIGLQEPSFFNAWSWLVVSGSCWRWSRRGNCWWQRCCRTLLKYCQPPSWHAWQVPLTAQGSDTNLELFLTESSSNTNLPGLGRDGPITLMILEVRDRTQTKRMSRTVNSKCIKNRSTQWRHKRTPSNLWRKRNNKSLAWLSRGTFHFLHSKISH